MTKIQRAIEMSCNTGREVRTLVTKAQRDELIAAATSVVIGDERLYVEASGTRDGVEWSIDAYYSPINELAEAPLTGAVVEYKDESVVTIEDRKRGRKASVSHDDNGGLFLRENGAWLPFEGTLQDIVDSWG